MIINGALECGPSPANPDGSSNRQKYYRRFAAAFGVDISGEKLGKLRLKSQRKSSHKRGSFSDLRFPCTIRVSLGY
jgi:hypothetical protein